MTLVLKYRKQDKADSGRFYIFVTSDQCWGKLLLKVMHYNIALLPKKVTNYVT